MSKIIITAIIFFSSFLTFSQSYKIIKSQADLIEVEVNFENYFVKDTLINERIFSIIKGGEFYLREPGQPWLPHYSFNIALPPLSNPSLEIRQVLSEALKNKYVLPFPKEDPEQSPFQAEVLDYEIYNANKFYPEHDALIDEPVTMRYANIASVQVSPFRFNPITRELIFNKKLTLKIKFNPRSDHNFSYQKINDQMTEDFLRTGVINFDEAKNWISKTIDLNISGSPPDSYWYSANKTYYKIYLKEKGVYRLSYDELISAGVNIPFGTPISKLEMFNEGKLIPIDIFDINGDTFFDSGDYINFIGGPPSPSKHTRQNIYNNTNVYWLSFDSENQFLYEDTDGFPNAWENTVQSSMHSILYEQDSLYERLGYAQDDMRDNWFWGRAHGMNGIPRSVFVATFPTLHNWNVNFPTVDLKVNMHGITDQSHTAKVYLTSQFIDSISWIRQNIATLETSFELGPISIFPQNNLQVVVEGRNVSDEIRVNWFELTYMRTHRVLGSRFIFKSNPNTIGTRYFSVFEWTGSDMFVYMPERGKVIKNPRFLNNSFREILFYDVLTERTEYYCVSSDTYLTVDSIAHDLPSDIRNPGNGADYIIITHKDFLPAAENLANFRRNNLSGFDNPRVAIVDVEEIYDEFSFGLLDPYALKEFAKYAFESWQAPAPKYVALLGDMSYDYRKLLPDSRPNFIPSLPHQQNTYGQAVADNNIVAVAGNDFIPDMIIGRISCETLAEANILVDKIMSYPDDNTKLWKQNVLLIGAGQTLSDENFFRFNDENILLENSYIKNNGYTASKVFRYPNKDAHVPFQGDGPQIREAFNDGAVLANFYGHGGGYQWDLVFLDDDIYLLENGGRLPMITSVTCYTAHFDNQNVFGEQFNKVPGKGSIGFWGHTGLTLWGTGKDMNKKIYNHIFNNKRYQIGDAIFAAKLEYSSQSVYYVNDHLALLTLLGDPALELALPQAPDFAITANNIKINPTFPLIDDSVSISLKIQNFGRDFPGDSVGVRISVAGVDTSFVLAELKMGNFGELDSIFVSWVPDFSGDIKITADVNYDNHIEEDDLSDNTATASFFVYSLKEPFVVKPLDGLNTLEDEINFVISDIGYYIGKPLRYHIQIDTSVYFSEPLHQDSLIQPGTSVVRWKSPQLTQGAYFWRARLFDGELFSNWTPVKTFRVVNESPNSFHISDNQLNLSEYSNINYIPENKGLVLNTSFLPPKPSFSKHIEDIHLSLPPGLSGLSSMTTDGKYIYYASMAFWNNLSPSKIYRIGTGNNGTVKGQQYGQIPNAEVEIWNTMFYYSDGFIYAAHGSSHHLTRINPETGDTSQVYIPDGLIDQFARVRDGAFYLNTDGRYVYNLAYRDTTGDPKYILRILDPQNNWSRVGEDKVLSGSSYLNYTNFFAAEGYIFPYERGISGFMRRINIETGFFEEEWLTNIPYQGYYCWTYDWQNNVVYSSVYTDGKTPKFSKFIGRYKEAAGQITTQPIGPASEWKTGMYRVDNQNPNASYKTNIEAYNNSTKRWDTVIVAPNPDFDLSSINAETYPLIRMNFTLQDSSFSNSLPIILEEIAINYLSFPEIEINKERFSFAPDTVLQGFDIQMKIDVQNIGLIEAENVAVEFFREDSDSAFYKHALSIPNDSSRTIEYTIPTSALSPATFHNINVRTTLQKPEMFTFNNVTGNGFYVSRDSIKPAFEITFDGKEIISGDIISAKPEILISLKDNSPLPIDTSYFTLIYSHNNSTIPLHFTRSDIEYSYTPYPNSEAVINWNPTLKDGRHTIEVLAKDASGNFFDSTSFRTDFFVYNDADLQNVINYPNPFTDDTHFTFELRGIQIPEEFLIKIYTIAGRLIRDISIPQSELTIGFNKFYWDGRDEDGDEIGNGLYFYKIISKHNGEVKTVTEKLAKLK
jgi:hypothetical protein